MYILCYYVMILMKMYLLCMYIDNMYMYNDNDDTSCYIVSDGQEFSASHVGKRPRSHPKYRQLGRSFHVTQSQRLFRLQVWRSWLHGMFGL